MPNYIDKEEMLEELIKHRKLYLEWINNGSKKEEKPFVCEKLYTMIADIATNYASIGKFSGYSWKEDMISEAITTSMKYCHNFNPEKQKVPQPFSYVTMICHNAFLNYIKKQNKHSEIKKELYDMVMLLMNSDDQYSTKAINYEMFKLFEKLKEDHIDIMCKDCNHKWEDFRNVKICPKCNSNTLVKKKSKIKCNNCGKEWKDFKNVKACPKCKSNMLYRPLERKKKKKV